jgi:signal transduction histidine kinase
MLSGTTVSAPSLPARRPPLRRLGERALMVFMLAVTVAVCLALLMRQSFGTTLVFSLCISFFCWVFIDGGRLVAARWMQRRSRDTATRGGWPGWPWMSACLLLGTPAGYLLGNALANRLTGIHDPGLLTPDPQEIARLMVIALLPAVFACFAFYSRARLAAAQAQAAAAERTAAEHQLMLLQSQLEPHMLFNTLANLRVLIGLDAARAQAMLDRLIAFLRATLEASRAGAHPLAAEFARLADYLALMQVRMGPRLTARFELPEALAALPVPPLLLQPLVENAVKHGLEPKVEGGRIEVRARRDGRRLVLEVRDSGVGLGAAAGDGTRFGLAQVRERLATLYGAAARLELAPAGDADGGTVATIELPIAP